MQGAAFRPSRSCYGDPPLFEQTTFGLERKLNMDDGFDRAAGRVHRKTKVVGCMELEPQLGVSWLCLTFQSIRSCASARARRSYCAAQPKLSTSFERRH